MQGDWDFLHHILEQYSHVFIHINIYNKDKFIINIFIHKYIHFFFLLKLVSINKTILTQQAVQNKVGIYYCNSSGVKEIVVWIQHSL